MIEHALTLDQPDSDETGIVHPSEWNAPHVITGLLGLIDQLAAQPGSFPALADDGTPFMQSLSAPARAMLAAATKALMLSSIGAAPLSSPVLTDVPTAPTAGLGTITEQLATTRFVANAIAALIGGSPELLNTLNEFAAALGNDPNFATTLATALAAKAPLDSPDLTGQPKAASPLVTDNTRRIATMDTLQSIVAGKVTSFGLRSDLAAANILPSTKSVMARARAAYDDLGAVQMIRALSQPAHHGRERSIDRYLPGGSIDLTDGGWWEAQGLFANPYWFDGAGDSTTNNHDPLQEMITYAEAKNCVAVIPAQTFNVAGNLRTAHAAQSDYIASAYGGPKIMGMGRRSILKGPYDAAPAAADYSDSANTPMGAQALLSIYRSNITIEGFAIHGAKVAMFVGQDPSQSVCSVTSNNVVQNVWGERIGTFMLFQNGLKAPTSGVGQGYYCKLSNLHFTDYQIGIHLAPWLWGINNGAPNTGNNNRHTFNSVRGSRGWCTYLIESGDGVDFFSCFGENGTYSTDHASFVGPSPAQLTPFVDTTTACGWVFAGEAASNNLVLGGTMEGVDRHVIDAGYKNDVFSRVDAAKSNFTVGNEMWRGLRFIEGENRLDRLSVGVGGTSTAFSKTTSATVTIGNVPPAPAAPSLAASIAVTGARPGDRVAVFPGDLANVQYRGKITYNDQVDVYVSNASASSVSVPTQTMMVEVKGDR